MKRVCTYVITTSVNIQTISTIPKNYLIFSSSQSLLTLANTILFSACPYQFTSYQLVIYQLLYQFTSMHEYIQYVYFVSSFLYTYHFGDLSMLLHALVFYWFLLLRNSQDCLLLLNYLVTSVKVQYPYMCGSSSILSILNHYSIFLCLKQYHSKYDFRIRLNVRQCESSNFLF